MAVKMDTLPAFSICNMIHRYCSALADWLQLLAICLTMTVSFTAVWQVILNYMQVNSKDITTQPGIITVNSC